MADDLSIFSQASLTLMASPSGLGGLASGEAMLRLEFETDRFRADVKQYISVFKKNTEETVKLIAQELLARIQRRTPVLTGRLRNSFHAVLPGETDTYFYQDNLGHGFYGGMDLPRPSNDDNEIGALVGTNVPYAIFIEAGHSRQAPNGMIAISQAEMATALEAALEKALGGLG